MGMMLASQVEHFSLQKLLYQKQALVFRPLLLEVVSFDAILNHCICHCICHLPDRFQKPASVQIGVVSMPDPGTMTGNYRSTFSSPVVSILENWYSKLLVKLRW